MQIYQLEAEVRLSKKYERTHGETHLASSYPLVSAFTSHAHDVTTIDDLYRIIRQTTDDPYRCLIKGALNRQLKFESRAGATDRLTETQWVCLDFDYIDLSGIDQLNELLAKMGLGRTTCIVQYGASHGITKKFSAHVFFMLDAPVGPAQLKNWLKLKNLDVPDLAAHLQLTKTSSALSWPLDVSLAQNDKLIYTAPPTCVGFAPPVPERVKLIRRDSDVARISAEIMSINPAVVAKKERAILNDLRVNAGLDKKTFKTKTLGDIEIMTNPDRSAVTGVKNERGFTYINMNGGDSFAYYFPQDNPEIVYNFKGEPNYLLKDLDPDFYREYKKAINVNALSEDDDTSVPFAFLDRRSDKYYRGFYYPSSDQIEIYGTDSVKKITDFAKQNALVLDDYIEEWDYHFRFDSDTVFSREDRFVNRYVQTPYLRRPVGDHALPEDLPPTIKRVLYSVVGADQDVLKHFLNWLACVIQYRKRTQTAWVFNGCEGTGKGVMFNYILSPLIGPAYCRTTRLATLEEDFNGFMEDCVFLMIDESKTSQVKNYEKVMALLKNVIVEPRIQIRRMRTDPYMVPNYMNVIVTSNHPDAIHISPTDRRFNVGVYQDTKLFLDEDDISRIRDELWDFARILRSIDANPKVARSVLENAARQRMMYLSETSVSIAAKAILSGNIEFFIDCLPTDGSFSTSALNVGGQIELERYLSVLREGEQARSKGEPHRLTRDQAQVLMKYAVGEPIPKTANKFTQMMKHYGVFFARKRKGGKIAPAFDVAWQDSPISVDGYVAQEHAPLKAVNNDE